MKKWKIAMVAGATLLGMSTASQAREFADIYTECGLGAMIAPNNSAVAAVTNVTWDLGTTAILSNASSEETCEGASSETAAYIHQAYPSIESDLAAGAGEHLTTLMQLAGIEADAQADYAANLRSAFAQLVAQPGYEAQSDFTKSAELHRLVFATAS